VIGHAVLSSFSRSDKDNAVSRTDNFVNVFNSVTSPPVLSYHCVLNCFLTISVGFHLNLTFGLKPEVGVFKIVSNCLQTIHFPSWVAHSHFDYLVLTKRGWGWMIGAAVVELCCSPSKVSPMSRTWGMWCRKLTVLETLCFWVTPFSGYNIFPPPPQFTFLVKCLISSAVLALF